jgi:hypothetical protein
LSILQPEPVLLVLVEELAVESAGTFAEELAVESAGMSAEEPADRFAVSLTDT